SACTCWLPAPLFGDATGQQRCLASFPTRRSSDLTGDVKHLTGALQKLLVATVFLRAGRRGSFVITRSEITKLPRRPARRKTVAKSEEHTSELQTRSEIVCRLLLEKKKEQLAFKVD